MAFNTLATPRSTERLIVTPNQRYAQQICDFVQSRNFEDQEVPYTVRDGREEVSEVAHFTRLPDREGCAVIQVKLIPTDPEADMRAIQIRVHPERYYITACQGDRSRTQEQISSAQRNMGGMQNVALMYDLKTITWAIKEKEET
jgi:hypothetical protein